VGVKSVRQVAFADHLWELYGRMAEEMGSDRESLLNQAMHVFARLNGYLLPAEAGQVPAQPAPPDPAGEQGAVAERVLETAARLEAEVRAREEAPPPIPSGPVDPGARELVLVREDGSETPVRSERFLIGRGRHCDLVIDSSKVSREHAAIVREGDGWLIEDLDSANGTWHRRARIDRRRIEDGDEYFVCAERLRCVLR
jgi:hypothetical protein